MSWEPLGACTLQFLAGSHEAALPLASPVSHFVESPYVSACHLSSTEHPSAMRHGSCGCCIDTVSDAARSKVTTGSCHATHIKGAPGAAVACVAIGQAGMARYNSYRRSSIRSSTGGQPLPLCSS